MADNSTIEWTDATWNMIRARNRATGKVGWHCEHVSPGCKHCYAEPINAVRFGTGLPFKPGHRDDVELFLDERTLLEPLRWRRPRKIFPGSMTDLFGDWVTDAMLDRIFAVMALCPQHTFQVLTKRSARMRAYLSDPGLQRRLANDAEMSLGIDATAAESMRNAYEIIKAGLPLPNVWLGVSAEDQTRADERVPDLLATPAAVRFVSAEPLLQQVDLRQYLRQLDWVIIGGESGPHAREFHLYWGKVLVDQCAAYATACFVKQIGDRPMHTADLDIAPRMTFSVKASRKGADMSEWPAWLRVREMPEARHG